MLECTSSERKNINREWESLYLSLVLHITHSLKCGTLVKKEILGLDKRRRLLLFWEISYYFGADSILEEVAGFSPLWFPRGKSLCVSCLL